MSRPDSPHEPLGDPRDNPPADPRVPPEQVGADAPAAAPRRPGGVRRFVARRSLLSLGAAALALILIASVVTAVVVNREQPELPTPQVMSAPGAAQGTSDCAPTAPESSDSPREGMEAVQAQNFAVSTANPLATEAACQVLASGGSAADGLLAAQAVLGLVEPQSSGFGGGGFAIYHDAGEDETTTYDGMEAAPSGSEPTDLAQVEPDGDDGAPQPSVRASGRSIGVPGIPALLGALHDDHGEKDWSESLAPAKALATDGFEVSKRLEDAVRGAKDELKEDRAAREYLMPDGRRVRAGDTLANPDYAATLDALAADPESFSNGELRDAVVDSARSSDGGRTPSRMEASDLEDYEVRTGKPLCIRYREAQLVCAPDAPESGGTAVLAALGTLGNVELPAPESPSDDGGDPDPTSAHLITEAERLALADRSAYSADPAFVEPPEGETFSLLEPDYLGERAGLLKPDESMDSAEPGKEPAITDDKKEEGTSHISIADGEGNMASMTTSLQSNFGSFHMAGGFFLNNHLENFATEPEKDGEPVANALAGGKRPRTAMAPTMVFTSREDGSIGTPFLATGSPGGSEITAYVVKNLVAMLDWGMDPQAAANLRNVGAISRSEAVVENGWGATDGKSGDDLVDELSGPGPDPDEASMPSGAATILRHDGALFGGADPRREGEVRGG